MKNKKKLLRIKTMPCGFKGSCLDCASFILSKNCSELKKLNKDEYNKHINSL